MALSANHWVLVWLSLELNIISFLPIINSYNWNQEQEACLKYLLFQALGSRILLLSSINTNLSLLILIAFLIKLGAAPFHFWFPPVIKSTPWIPSTLLLTWQKIAPLCLLFFLSTRKSTLLFLGGINAIIGGVGGMNQSHLRPLLAYSSIGHIGWILTRIYMSPSISIFYITLYIFISLTIIVTAASTNTLTVLRTKNKNNILTLILCVLLLSLAGLPPLAGFFPKLIVISSIKSFILPLVLILGSLINLFYYLNIFFNFFLRNFTQHIPPQPLPLWYSTLLNLSTNPLFFIFILLIVL